MNQRFCTFWVGPHFLGIEVERIQEVLRVERSTPVPLAPPEVSGLINLRGQFVTAIDLRRRFRIENEQTHHDNSMHLILSDEKGAISFVVDQIGDVVEVDAESFEDPPETLQGESRRMILGAYKLAERLMLVIDADHASDFSTNHRPDPGNKIE